MAKRDLTKERDEKCVPIAKEVLKILASQDDLLIGDASEVTREQIIDYYSDLYFNEILPILKREDLKINDISYVFRLVKQAINLLEERTTMTVEHHFNDVSAYLFGVEDTDEVTTNSLIRFLEMKAEGEGETLRDFLEDQEEEDVDNSEDDAEE